MAKRVPGREAKGRYPFTKTPTIEWETLARLEGQVGGHHGRIYMLPDKKSILKPSSTKELDFYSNVNSNPTNRHLSTLIPKFYGRVLVQPAKCHQEFSSSCLPILSDHHDLPSPRRKCSIRFLHIENLATSNPRWVNPSIIDVKIGTQLHDDDAGVFKVANSKLLSSLTTSKKYGLRIDGFKVSRSWIRFL